MTNAEFTGMVRLSAGVWKARKEDTRFFIGTTFQRPDIRVDQEFVYESNSELTWWRITHIDRSGLSFLATELDSVAPEEKNTHQIVRDALAQIHGQNVHRTYSVAEVKQIVYPLVQALREERTHEDHTHVRANQCS